MQKQIIDVFERLTNINSPSGKEGDVARVLEDRLKDLGFECSRDKAGNIIGRRGEGEPLLLCCHMDTVKPNEDLDIERKGEWLTTDGTTILGADDKAGISVLLSALPEVGKSIPLEVVFSVREEEGMKGTLSLKKESLSARVGLVLDAGEPVGSVINEAPGETGVALIVKGKTAHAAVDPESGIDAIRLTAKFLAALPEHRIDEDTSFNFGVIRGGKVTNQICDRVELEGEVRSFSEERREEVCLLLNNLLEQTVKAGGGTVEVKHIPRYQGYHVEDDHPLMTLLQSVSGEEVKLDIHRRPAGSDANALNSMGITVVNLGVGYKDGHTVKERASVPEMEKLARWLVHIITGWKENGGLKH